MDRSEGDPLEIRDVRERDSRLRQHVDEIDEVDEAAGRDGGGPVVLEVVYAFQNAKKTARIFYIYVARTR